ncbi:uncharacterized protein LOC101846473 [Aplysia californica]|uniref:Uncharacterized protein LOC101846473 n=1 Tax=Aplysia californica TaxID=6500 RepID=A0ABM1AD86_APLCA|nr:uncharacterized protein LOC101846473 [Aplysia californica]
MLNSTPSCWFQGWNNLGTFKMRTSQYAVESATTASTSDSVTPPAPTVGTTEINYGGGCTVAHSCNQDLLCVNTFSGGGYQCLCPAGKYHTGGNLCSHKPGPISALSSSSVTATGIVVSWQKPSKPNGDLKGYKVWVTRDGQCVKQFHVQCPDCDVSECQSPMPSSPVSQYDSTDLGDFQGSFEVTVTDLLPYTDYIVHVRAYNREIGGGADREVSFKTGEAAASPVTKVELESLPLTAQGRLDLKVSWVPGYRNGETTFTVVIKEKESLTSENFIVKQTRTFQDAFGITSDSVHDVLGHWVYQVTVKAKTNVGDAAVSSPQTITTLNKHPEPVTALTLTKSTQVASEVSLSFGCPEERERNGVITGFYISTSDGTSNLNIQFVNATSCDNVPRPAVQVVVGESPTDYTFKVMASNGQYNSSYVMSEIVIRPLFPEVSEYTATDFTAESSGSKNTLTSFPVTVCLSCLKDLSNRQGSLTEVVLAVCKNKCGGSGAASTCHPYSVRIPQNGNKTCFSNGAGYTCNLTCNSGYVFYDDPEVTHRLVSCSGPVSEFSPSPDVRCISLDTDSAARTQLEARHVIRFTITYMGSNVTDSCQAEVEKIVRDTAGSQLVLDHLIISSCINLGVTGHLEADTVTLNAISQQVRVDYSLYYDILADRNFFNSCTTFIMVIFNDLLVQVPELSRLETLTCGNLLKQGSTVTPSFTGFFCPEHQPLETQNGISFCLVCPVGTYQTEAGSCQDCPAGTFSLTPDSRVCQTCGADNPECTRRRKSETEKVSLKTWADAKKEGFTGMYRVTPRGWHQDLLRRPGGQYVFTVGEDNSCSDNGTDFCNGPLPAREEFQVLVIVCNGAGCVDYLNNDSVFGTTTDVDNDDDNIVVIVWAVICSVLVVGIILAVIFFICRRRRQKDHKEIGPVQQGALEETEMIKTRRPILIRTFRRTLVQLHGDSNLLFRVEFEDMQKLSARLPNGNKPVDELPYINVGWKLPRASETMEVFKANYIEGYNSMREYIAAQGPMPSTVPDFWRMVWEHRCKVIVMVSDQSKGWKGKRKLYWPENLDESVEFGNVEVKMIHVSVFNKYVIRNLQISMGSETRQISHFSLHGWTNAKADLTVDDVVRFVQIVRQEARLTDSSPFVVHCSTGVGHTGTFIALDYLSQYVDKHSLDENIDVFSYVMKMRENCPGMVQTESQYMFIFDALMEVIQKKITEEQEKLNDYIDESEEDMNVTPPLEEAPDDLTM